MWKGVIFNSYNRAYVNIFILKISIVSSIAAFLKLSSVNQKVLSISRYHMLICFSLTRLKQFIFNGIHLLEMHLHIVHRVYSGIKILGYWISLHYDRIYLHIGASQLLWDDWLFGHVRAWAVVSRTLRVLATNTRILIFLCTILYAISTSTSKNKRIIHRLYRLHRPVSKILRQIVCCILHFIIYYQFKYTLVSSASKLMRARVSICVRVFSKCFNRSFNCSNYSSFITEHSVTNLRMVAM